MANAICNITSIPVNFAAVCRLVFVKFDQIFPLAQLKSAIKFAALSRLVFKYNLTKFSLKFLAESRKKMPRNVSGSSEQYLEMRNYKK